MNRNRQNSDPRNSPPVDKQGKVQRMMTAAAIFGRIWRALRPAYRRNEFRKYCANARSCAVRRRLMRQLHHEWADETR